MPRYSTAETLFIQPEKSLTVVNSDNAVYRDMVDPNDTEKVYSNQRILGKAHPKTKIAPIITAPAYDYDVWRDTPLTALSRVNSRSRQFPTDAGYSTTELVDSMMDCSERKELLERVKQSPLIQTVQPGVYTVPAAYDVINVNAAGPAYVPQFEPIRKINQDGNVGYSSKYDARPPSKKEEEEEEDKVPLPPPSSKENYEPEEDDRRTIFPPTERDVNIYNVYDPRFSGYGSSDRAYLDPLLHQTRYYYDDVDAIRRPNYLVRSKLDSCVTPFGDTYGPQHTQSYTLNETRALAERTYLDNHLNFRNDMMESLMRKRNSEMWQVRTAPKYTTRQGR